MTQGLEAPIVCSDPSADWLLGDIGGTHARFVHARGLEVAGAERFVVDGRASFQDAIAAAIEQVGEPVKRAAFCIAATISGDQLKLTNRDWTASASDLRRALDLDELVVVNDFAANGAGVAALDSGDGEPIGPRLPPVDGPTRVVFGPGTGLGAAALRHDPDSSRVLETEAGHLAWAPDPDDADAMIVARCARVFESVRREWGRVSWEHVLSGNGLVRIDAALADADLRAAADISAAAQAGEPRAVRAAQCFSRQVGRYAAEICFAFHATGGLYVTGGVLEGLGTAFDEAACRHAFEASVGDGHPHAGWLRATTLIRITIKDLAYRGLAEIASGRVLSPGLHLRRE
ncbi:glucokinase [soil metagenome]